MKTIRIAAALGLASLLVAVIWAVPLQAAHAQCGLPGTPDCEPGGGGKDTEKEKKRPTATNIPTATATPTATLVLVPLSGGGEGLPTAIRTSTPTIDPSLLATARACWDSMYRKTPAPELPTASWGDIQVDAPQCIPTFTPTKVPPISATYVAGPIFVAPGVKNAIIAVLLIGVLLGGLIIVARRVQPPGPPNKKPPSPNK
jgi:hypothetical protein